MPPLARWHIKAGLVYLAGALTIGVLLAAQPVFALPGTLHSLRPVFLHLLIVGWLTQLVFGVAYWMFPKASKEQPRGSERMGWLTFGLLNAGLLLRAVAEPWFALNPRPQIGAGLAIAAVAQMVAGWLFIANTWTRVKER
jgi:hypothetical protein